MINVTDIRILES